ncbi:hypothetical protein [Alteromonas sp. a30]|uniref:hypothetical protein n=1 Tax=Alteromonas sp. a30 TaxID=2730917 RepID=UPI0022802555|nr:hypothetical protein [Alteromonas sp. a30]MCY7293855.1 hypothetical protein [Alteromonas sp. a30]
MKKIMLVVLLVALGYLIAFWFPLPENLSSKLSELSANSVNTIEAQVTGNETSEQQSEDKVLTEALSKNTAPTNEVIEGDSQQTTYIGISDLMFSSKNLPEKATLSLDSFPSKQAAEQFIADRNIEETVFYFDFMRPTGSQWVLVTLGEFSTQNAAQEREKALEIRYDINLSVVRLPPPQSE